MKLLYSQSWLFLPHVVDLRGDAFLPWPTYHSCWVQKGSSSWPQDHWRATEDKSATRLTWGGSSFSVFFSASINLKWKLPLSPCPADLASWRQSHDRPCIVISPHIGHACTLVPWMTLTLDSKGYGRDAEDWCSSLSRVQCQDWGGCPRGLPIRNSRCSSFPFAEEEQEGMHCSLRRSIVISPCSSSQLLLISAYGSNVICLSHTRRWGGICGLDWKCSPILSFVI